MPAKKKVPAGTSSASLSALPFYSIDDLSIKFTQDLGKRPIMSVRDNNASLRHPPLWEGSITLQQRNQFEQDSNSLLGWLKDRLPNKTISAFSYDIPVSGHLRLPAEAKAKVAYRSEVGLEVVLVLPSSYKKSSMNEIAIGYYCAQDLERHSVVQKKYHDLIAELYFNREAPWHVQQFTLRQIAALFLKPDTNLIKFGTSSKTCKTMSALKEELDKIAPGSYLRNLPLYEERLWLKMLVLNILSFIDSIVDEGSYYQYDAESLLKSVVPFYLMSEEDLDKVMHNQLDLIDLFQIVARNFGRSVTYYGSTPTFTWTSTRGAKKKTKVVANVIVIEEDNSDVVTEMDVGTVFEDVYSSIN